MSKGDNKPKSLDDKKMVDKVNQQLSPKEDSMFSKLLGIGLIVLGVLLVILAVVAVIMSRKEAEIDEDMTIPTLEVERYTRDDEVVIEGETDEKGKVMLWVDGEEVKATIKADDEGMFEYILEVEEEGEYEIEAATIAGWLVKTRSPKSDPVKVEVDRTAPSSDIQLNYKSTSTREKLALSGETKESGTTVILRGDEKYEVTSDKDGKFRFEDVVLAEGDNTFTVVLEDKAGNQKELARKIEVNYKPSAASINGDGASIQSGDESTPDIPEAAGELEAALNSIFANKLMMSFGMIALIALVGSSTMVYKKMNV